MLNYHVKKNWQLRRIIFTILYRSTYIRLLFLKVIKPIFKNICYSFVAISKNATLFFKLRNKKIKVFKILRVEGTKKVSTNE